MTLLKTAVWSAVLLLAVSLPATAQQQPSCPNPQSPRNLNPSTIPTLYDRTSKSSIVQWTPPATSIQYYARPGCVPQTLQRCGQHYHAPVENTQGCPGETGQGWVEIHTVFAAEVNSGSCDPVTLECCKKGPFVVLAYSAKVTPGGTTTPIVPPVGRPLAEWSGSTTNADNVFGECKPPAEWSFRLGCGFTVSEAQLKPLKHPDPARPVQPCHRLSRDLTKVVP